MAEQGDQTRPTPAKRAILGTSLFAPEVADIVEDGGEFEVSVFIENRERFGRSQRPSRTHDMMNLGFV